MGRIAPRFLFSNPKNTKSPGPFIIHTIDPQFIVRLSLVAKPIHRTLQETHNGKYRLIHIEENIEVTSKLIDAVEALYKWADYNEEVQEWVKLQG